MSVSVWKDIRVLPDSSFVSLENEAPWDPLGTASCRRPSLSLVAVTNDRTRHVAERPLRGRDREFALLAAVVDRARSGGGGVAVVRGDPGIGKTALLHAVVARAPDDRRLLLRGGAGEFEQDRPFGVWADMLGSASVARGPEAGAERGAALIAHTDASNPGELRYVITRRIIEFLEDQAASRSVVVTLDDAQWADETSLHVLDQLARRVQGTGIALLVARRTAPRSAALDRIEEVLGVETVHIGPLPPDVIKTIATDVVKGDLDESLLAALGEADGSPFLAILMAELATRGDPASMDRSGAETVARHLAAVSNDGLETLKAASIIGPRFGLTDLGIVSGTDAMQLWPRLEDARAVGVIRPSGDLLEFRHDLIWRAIYESIPEPIRQGLHREFAHRLAGSDERSDRVISHLLIGAQPGHGDDLDLLRRTAEGVAARDPATAAGLYERALDLSADRPDQAAILAGGLVNTLLWSGQFYRAKTRSQALLEAPLDASVKGDVRRALGRVLAYQGKVESSLAEVETALTDDSMPDTLRARLLADASLRRLVCGDPVGASRAADEALALAAERGDAVATTLARCAASRVSGYEGYVDRAIDLAERSTVVANGRAEEAIELLQPPLYLGLALIDADRLSDARTILTEGRDLAELLGSVWMVPLFHLGLALEAYLVGDWERSTTEADTGLAAADELNTFVWVPWTQAVRALMAVAQGDPAEPHLAVIDGARRSNGASQFGDAWLTWAAIRHLEANGRPEAAIERGLSAWRAVDGQTIAGDRRVYAVDLVRLLMAADRVDEAGAVIRVLDVVADRSGTDADRAALSHARGLLARDTQSILEASDWYANGGRRSSQAHAMEDAARLLVETGAKDAALTTALGAAEIHERMGAVNDLARVGALLRSLGHKRGVKARRKRARTGWESVTATETQVLELLARGLTNRQIAERLFISPRTVETHVAHLFGKLDASSRAELAAQQAQHAIQHP